MTHQSVPMIQGQNLYPAEKEKLERLDSRLISVFAGAGYPDVRLCEGAGEGNDRKLSFRRNGDGSRLISFTSLAFLGSSGEELMSMISHYLGSIRRR